MARRSRGRSSKRGYYWDGVQWPRTSINSGQTALVLIDSTAQEFMPATLVRVRGYIHLDARGSVSETEPGDVMQKMMYVEINDAQAMTGDHSGIDTHEEDIAQRQIWTHAWGSGKVAAESVDTPQIQIEVDVKVKIKIEPHGKKLLLLLQDSSTSNLHGSTGYLRCLLQHG